MKFVSASLILSSFSAVAANPTYATDYAASSDVTEHGKVDLDMASILTNIESGSSDDVAAALATYTDGEFSAKTSSMRTLKGFSTAIDGKAWTDNYKEMAYALAKASEHATDYADALVQEQFATSTVSTNAVAVAINFANTQMYTMHELYDAVLDVSNGDAYDNDGAAKAWDEAVAFYAGSTQVKGVSGANSMYGLIESVSTYFGATDPGNNVIAPINQMLMDLFVEGRDKIAGYSAAIDADEETALLGIAEEIHGLFTAANIQWLIYSHKNAGVSTDDKAALLKILATVIYPELNACNTNDAATFKEHTITTPSGVSDNWESIMSALQENYHCMIRVKKTDKYHQSCSIVGAYDDTTNTQATCDDADIYPYESTQETVSGETVTVSKEVAGYQPRSDVAKHALLDKDMRRIGLLAGAGDFINAKRVYSDGWNSWKTNDDGTFKSWRNYQAFASSSKLALFPEGQDLNDYYGSYTALDTFISAALDGTTPFAADTDATARKEMAGKTLQFGLNLYYVIREFYDAIDDCTAESLTNNYGNVHAWDEGVMFWAGSLEKDGSGSGELLHMLGEKRADNYDYTNAEHGKTASTVNADLVALYLAGEAHLVAGECGKALPIVDDIIAKMIVPVIQGAQRYAWKVGSGASATAKSRAEGWAFAKSILPMVAKCDATSAETIVANMDYFASEPMADGTEAVFEAWQKTFACLGVTCSDIGELNEVKDGYPNPPACKDTFSEDLGGSAATVGVRAGAVIAAIAGGFIMML
ncbi:hypothetical protein TrLO_g8260 [Triparma laevis f. longispina]|uniref:Uncharacterized protein n=1 Tax=Triparma laevis f. longispina TaxID=1714387 RepID=A0A9W7F8V7_9STRA|nr:hypothetical protein TrLO_g8260 [Triparma laevis f. longispina]